MEDDYHYQEELTDEEIADRIKYGGGLNAALYHRGQEHKEEHGESAGILSDEWFRFKAVASEMCRPAKDVG